MWWDIEWLEFTSLSRQWMEWVRSWLLYATLYPNGKWILPPYLLWGWRKILIEVSRDLYGLATAFGPGVVLEFRRSHYLLSESTYDRRPCDVVQPMNCSDVASKRSCRHQTSYSINFPWYNQHCRCRSH
jgi:hypothetical protein